MLKLTCYVLYLEVPLLLPLLHLHLFLSHKLRVVAWRHTRNNTVASADLHRSRSCLPLSPPHLTTIRGAPWPPELQAPAVADPVHEFPVVGDDLSPLPLG